MKLSSCLALSFLATLSIAIVPIRVSAIPTTAVASGDVGTQPDLTVEGNRLQPIAPDTEAEPSTQPTGLPQVLLGHWVTNGGQTHYFFSENKVTIINVINELQEPERAQPAFLSIAQEASASEQTNPSLQVYQQIMRYEVSFVNESNNMMYVRIETPLAWAEQRWLRFSSDRQQVVETIHVLGHELSAEWTYVSDRQTPPAAISSLGF